MGMYKFAEGDAYRFSQELGYHARRNGKELVFKKCPYCGNSTDKTNKFSISLETGQFECKRASCGAKGNMITLARDFNFSLGREVDTYYQTTDYSHKQYRTFKDAHRIAESKPAAIDYLKSRGIPETVITEYEITTKPDKDNIIVFPFKDETGKLTFIKYRNSTFKKGDSGNKEWCEKDCKPILFGMNHCDPEAEDGRIVITEGQIDSLSVVAAGFKNAVSVPTGCRGFTWVPYCYNFINQFRQIIVMGDCENGKITLADELAKRWPTKVRVCRQEDYQGYKDANEILQNVGVPAIKNAIDNAEAPYNNHIKPLAKVKQVDIMSIPTIKTEIAEIDKVLDGGFRVGQLAVLTGKRGQGKSTIASMWGVQAIAQGWNCFFYSGELPDFYFRNWMDCQVTGKGEHSKSDNDKLDVWYGDKAFIYDQNLIEQDELTDLISVIEVAIIQNNCKFILLDNLMTALEDDLSTDLYRNQSKFVGNLAVLAKKYEVFILLIAHPRKNNGGDLTNDDISGSSNITDKADLVFGYSRPNKEENDDDPNHKRLSIMKNRLTGKLAEGKKAIHLVYDDSGSRRIAASTEELFRIGFDWNKDPYGFESVDDMEEIPF